MYIRKGIFGMQLNETGKMALEFNKKMREYFGDRVKDFVIYDVDDDPNHRAFSIDFDAYNYFNIITTYEKGRFGCSIQYGKYCIGLDNSQKWWDTADFNIFFKELKEELELRIPDKYLEAKGWK